MGRKNTNDITAAGVASSLDVSYDAGTQGGFPMAVDFSTPVRPGVNKLDGRGAPASSGFALGQNRPD